VKCGRHRFLQHHLQTHHSTLQTLGLRLKPFARFLAGGQKFSSNASRTSLGTVQAPTKPVLGVSSTGNMWPQREADNSATFIADFENEWSLPALSIWLHSLHCDSG